MNVELIISIARFTCRASFDDGDLNAKQVTHRGRVGGRNAHTFEHAVAIHLQGVDVRSD